MDGAEDYIMWFYDVCAKYNIKVLMDVHGMKDSQNGYDNSGKTTDLIWSTNYNFTHEGASRWFGDWDHERGVYKHINFGAINWGLMVHEHLLQKFGAHSAFYAFEPINEPQTNPIVEVLFEFYRRSRKLVQKYTAGAKFVFHNGNVNSEIWNDLFRDDDMEDVIIDIHFYQAWMDMNTIQDYCGEAEDEVKSKSVPYKYPVWIGEWSLATDICAFWLNGFNSGWRHPQHTCNLVDCPYSYLPAENAVDFNRSAEIIGPFGPWEYVKENCVSYGKCPIDSNYFNSTQVGELARCVLGTFDKYVNATFFWTAHNELEPRWDYVKAWDLGWINKTALALKRSMEVGN